MSKKKLAILLSMVLAAVVALSGCGNDAKKPADTKEPAKQEQKAEKKDEKKDEKKAEEKAPAGAETLADWDGPWDNLVNHFNDPELKESFEKASTRDGVTVDQFKKDLTEKRHFDFGGIKIDGKTNTVTFFDGPADKGKEVAKGTYKFVKTAKVEHEGEQLEWDLFESADVNNPALKFISLMPVHGEESLTHFHMRNGDNGDKLLDPANKWYPALIKPTSTVEQLKGEIEE